MESFTSFDGVEIAYLREGEGSTVLLLHGFAADHRLNWVNPGVVSALVSSGRRVIAPDARGHGASGKPHDPAAYAGDAMPSDAQALLDHLGVDRVDLVGYSMGSMVSARLTPMEPRVRSLILGGVGGRFGATMRPRHRDSVADALDTDGSTDPTAKAFRKFAEATGADLKALTALQRAPLGDPPELTRIGVPTMVLTGDKDVLVGTPQSLAEFIPGATAKIISGDHLGAVNDPAFAASIVEFIDSVSIA
jgi:pimeloyl-ACP methyl ester carboxylesterase